jgi:hypothetical protein
MKQDRRTRSIGRKEIRLKRAIRPETPFSEITSRSISPEKGETMPNVFVSLAPNTLLKSLGDPTENNLELATRLKGLTEGSVRIKLKITTSFGDGFESERAISLNEIIAARNRSLKVLRKRVATI